jgi:putative endonuclease
MEKIFCVYIMTNENNTALYTGVTSNLSKRVWEHREKLVRGFTKRYNITKLVYYEACGNAYAAISREKQIKAGSRKKKEELIGKMNPRWKDLSAEI